MFRKSLNRSFSTTYPKLKAVKIKNAKSTSSHDWLSRQFSDPYVEKAKILNYRCRSAFKLLEMDERFKLFQPGQVVVDCGAAPGSWTQVAVKGVNSDGANKGAARGIVVSIDRQQIFPIPGATILGNLDFTSEGAQQNLFQVLANRKTNVVISDMAPKATGVSNLDNENIIHLCYMALRFSVQVSEVGASLIVKLWQCGEAKKLETDINKFYNSVRFVKPQASRSDSAEIFLLGRDFKGLL